MELHWKVIVPGLVLGTTMVGIAPVAQADPVPTLGIAHPSSLPWADGLGTVRPGVFSLASTGSSTVRQVTWDSWGGPQATGHGLEANGADHPNEPVTVVAFDLGTCDGQMIYRQLNRIGPGRSFDTGVINNLCHG
jgi:hypothetical protein